MEMFPTFAMMHKSSFNTCILSRMGSTVILMGAIDAHPTFLPITKTDISSYYQTIKLYPILANLTSIIRNIVNITERDGFQFRALLCTGKRV